MRWACAILLLCGFTACEASAQSAPAGQTVDRIVARVEDDVILLSEVRELAAYQQLVDGHSQTREQLVEALIEQWAVRSEAEQANFGQPAKTEIDAEMKRIQGTFPSAAAYRERLAAVGLTQEAVRHMVEQQFYLERYLDYKFRPAVQVTEENISKYYQEQLAPAVRARGENPPPLGEVEDQIRELLVQQGINERANTWFEETKSRLRIEIEPAQTADSQR